MFKVVLQKSSLALCIGTFYIEDPVANGILASIYTPPQITPVQNISDVTQNKEQLRALKWVLRFDQHDFKTLK